MTPVASGFTFGERALAAADVEGGEPLGLVREQLRVLPYHAHPLREDTTLYHAVGDQPLG